MSDSNQAVVAVITTVPDPEVAESIARTVVEERLAACANLLGSAVSIFRWESRVEREVEVLVIMKTTRQGIDDLRRRIVDLHPYDVPELIVLPVQEGYEPYLQWVRSEVGSVP